MDHHHVFYLGMELILTSCRPVCLSVCLFVRPTIIITSDIRRCLRHHNPPASLTDPVIIIIILLLILLPSTQQQAIVNLLTQAAAPSATSVAAGQCRGRRPGCCATLQHKKARLGAGLARAALEAVAGRRVIQGLAEQ